MQQERRHKTTMTKVAEVVTLLTGLGIFGLLVTVGEYKANFKAMCDRVSELKSAIDANAETNSKAHIVLKNEIVRTQQAVIIYTGKAIP